MGHLLDWYTDPEKFQGEVNLKVIKFIDEITNFPDRDGESGEQIDHLFSAGYCYYFASMLKTAFGGQLCWAQDRGHIVWADIQEGCTFDELQKACAPIPIDAPYPLPFSAHHSSHERNIPHNPRTPDTFPQTSHKKYPAVHHSLTHTPEAHRAAAIHSPASSPPG